MTKVVLKSTSKEGYPIKATFLPDQGMNLISYKKGDVEVIDQSTLHLFEERYAGLGAMIGPHFYHQKEELLATIANEKLFPHIQKVKMRGGKDFFSHGIGRYAPWNYEVEGSYIKAHLSGEDKWNDIPLSMLENTSFSMNYHASLDESGLHIHMDVTCDRPSLVGLHTYYTLGAENIVYSQVQKKYNDMGTFKIMPERWLSKNLSNLEYNLAQPADYGFLPIDHKNGKAILDTPTHKVVILFRAPTDQVSFQLYHPADASFACVEPMSAKNPRGLEVENSEIDIDIDIEFKR